MFKEVYNQIRSRIKNASNVLIISHREPDADTLGGAVSIKCACDRFGVANTLACVDKPDNCFSYIPHVSEFVSSFDLSAFDLVVVIDAGAYYMTNFHIDYPSIFNGAVDLINIDHHASNELFGTINLVDVNAPSVTCILYEMFLDWGFDFPESVATALLGGIYGDTGCFMHTNSNERVFEIAADLMGLGANLNLIVRNLFKNSPVSKLRLWGKVFENSSITDGGIVVSVVTDTDLSELGVTDKHLSGVVDYLSMVPNSKFSILLNEDKAGNVRGSLRTRCEGVDLSRVARVFGGGGHPGASGFTVPGRLSNVSELG